jgi:methionyl-tRNA synthetase
MTKSRYTVTAALPYANGPLHLGHVAGVYLPADIFVRFLRMNGHDVAFICGSDEHGAAITLRAKKEGITPQEIVDKYNKIIGDSFKKFDMEGKVCIDKIGVDIKDLQNIINQFKESSSSQFEKVCSSIL